jgi:hypothetical protein
MQNMDFYSGKEARVMNHSMGLHDADNVARLDAMYRKEADRNKKKASRMMSVIVGLCIISFTAGLIVGIKFAAGSQAQIIDDDTRNAVTQIGNRVSNLIPQATQPVKGVAPKNVFPKSEYPYVIRLNRQYVQKESQDVAQYLSQRGHTVILSKKNSRFAVYVGPYKAQNEAESSLKQISEYGRNEWFDKTQVVKR